MQLAVLLFVLLPCYGTPSCPVCIQELTNLDLVTGEPRLSVHDHLTLSGLSFWGEPPLPEIVKTPCRHIFHYQCLKAWLDTGHQTCPLCRASYSLQDLPKAEWPRPRPRSFSIPPICPPGHSGHKELSEWSLLALLLHTVGSFIALNPEYLEDGSRNAIFLGMFVIAWIGHRRISDRFDFNTSWDITAAKAMLVTAPFNPFFIVKSSVRVSTVMVQMCASVYYFLRRRELKRVIL